MNSHKDWRGLWSGFSEHPIRALTALFLSLAPLWKLVSKASDTEFLLTFSQTKVGKFVLGHWDWLTMLLGFILLYFTLRPAKPAHAEIRPGLLRRWALRRYTTAGLSWRVFGHAEIQGKAVAILRITSSGDLPQPLEIVVTCLGGIESVGPSFHPDPVKPTERDADSDIEVEHPGGRRVVSFVLRSPKLQAPGFLDVTLRSIGNAEIRVIEVRRNPQ